MISLAPCVLSLSLVQSRIDAPQVDWSPIDVLASHPVDSFLTGPVWVAEGDQPYAIFGISVATAGDVNGDGFSDVVAGAFWYDNGQEDEGRAFSYLGSAAGLSTSADWTAESNQSRALFGCSVAAAGDVNGDGYGDVIVGAEFFGQSNEGRAFLYLGSAAGLSSSAAWVMDGDQVDAYFGSSVATAGDVNGDGYSDVLVGADSASRAYLFLGSATGLSTHAAWLAEGEPLEYMGHCVAPAGDVNGDGFSDVLVGSFVRARVYLGSCLGLSDAAWMAESDQFNSLFGYSVAGAGDVNGDGYDDILVGAYGRDGVSEDEGRAYLYAGSATGLSATPAWTADGRQLNPQFGYCVSSAGDTNGDGYDDVLVGAPRYHDGKGRVFLYSGSAAGLSTDAAWTGECQQEWAWFGQSVGQAGDVNGDGFGDVIIAAPSFSHGQESEGRAFLYLGSGPHRNVCLDFETEDDFMTPLGNGQKIDTEFGRIVRISSTGANAGPATFDTTPAGLNDPPLNHDMLIGHGNVLLLEDDWHAWSETIPGYFDEVTDDPHGGSLILDFIQPVNPQSILLVDINPPPNLGASVALVDRNGGMRTYAIEPGWTGGYGNAGPWRLDLTTTLPQPGNGTPRFARATQDAVFKQADVIRMVIRLTGFGAVDELCFFQPHVAIRNGSGREPVGPRPDSGPACSHVRQRAGRR